MNFLIVKNVSGYFEACDPQARKARLNKLAAGMKNKGEIKGGSLDNKSKRIAKVIRKFHPDVKKEAVDPGQRMYRLKKILNKARKDGIVKGTKYPRAGMSDYSYASNVKSSKGDRIVAALRAFSPQSKNNKLLKKDLDNARRSHKFHVKQAKTYDKGGKFGALRWNEAVVSEARFEQGFSSRKKHAIRKIRAKEAGAAKNRLGNYSANNQSLKYAKKDSPKQANDFKLVKLTQAIQRIRELKQSKKPNLP